MIVNSKMLWIALSSAMAATPSDAKDDRTVSFHQCDIGVEVSGQYVTNVLRDWEDFEVDVDKAMKLARLLSHMAEQPITVVYDGNWFTIKEVLV